VALLVERAFANGAAGLAAAPLGGVAPGLLRDLWRRRRGQRQGEAAGDLVGFVASAGRAFQAPAKAVTFVVGYLPEPLAEQVRGILAAHRLGAAGKGGFEAGFAALARQTGRPELALLGRILDAGERGGRWQDGLARLSVLMQEWLRWSQERLVALVEFQAAAGAVAVLIAGLAVGLAYGWPFAARVYAATSVGRAGLAAGFAVLSGIVIFVWRLGDSTDIWKG
jgi:Flp pilus assembly protein TadB